MILCLPISLERLIDPFLAAYRHVKLDSPDYTVDDMFAELDAAEDTLISTHGVTITPDTALVLMTSAEDWDDIAGIVRDASSRRPQGAKKEPAVAHDTAHLVLVREEREVGQWHGL